VETDAALPLGLLPVHVALGVEDCIAVGVGALGWGLVGLEEPLDGFVGGLEEAHGHDCVLLLFQVYR